MKLYTEEQVRKAIELAREVHTEGSAYMERDEYDYSQDEIINLLKPIELPSDEAIDEQSWGYREVTKDMEIPPNEDWSNGAKWMREQTFNQNP
jgi:hypothetical protein